ncbi:hypothetical protein SLE2022_127470 [Rubroshorea leprosula]
MKKSFSLEHAFGDSDFVPAGTFSACLKTWNHGGQTLTKLWFSRNGFTNEEKEKFKNLLQGDDFYKIRLSSNVLSPRRRDYIISSVKAPFKWAFNSHMVLKDSEQAPRAPIFTKEFWVVRMGRVKLCSRQKDLSGLNIGSSQAQPAAAMQCASNAAVRRR